MAELDEKQERIWGLLVHLLAFFGFIAPLIIWLIQRDESSFIDDQGKESLNFQISILIYLVVSMLLMFIVIGFVLVPAVLVFDVVMIIVASVKASAGEKFRYPLCIKFIK